MSITVLAQPSNVADAKRILARFSGVWADPSWGDRKLYPWASLPHQMAIRQAVRSNRLVSVRSANSMGKTTDVNAKTAIDFVLGHYPSWCCITSATWTSLHQTTVPPIRQFIAQINERLKGVFEQPTAEGWFPLGREHKWGIVFRSPKNPLSIAGLHNEWMLAEVDEASGLEPEVQASIDGITVGAEDIQLYTGNPLDPSGIFYDSHTIHRDLWSCHHLDAYDSPNVKQGRAIVPGMATVEWIDKMRRKWGEQSPEFQARVRGNFPESGALTMLSRADVEIAMNLPEPTQRRGPVIVSADFGFSKNGDPTVFFVSDDAGEIACETHYGLNHVQAEGEFKRVLSKYNPAKAYCDEGGLVGMQACMREAGFNQVVGVMAGSKPHNEEYHNLRSETMAAWGKLLRSGTFWLSQETGKLMRDQAGIQRKPQRSGKILLESKDEIKKRIGRSTDHLDVGALRCVEPLGELVIETVSPKTLIHQEPIVFCEGGEWFILNKGLTRKYARQGQLLRASWYSPRGPSGAVWCHKDEDGTVVVFDALVERGRMLPEDWERRIVTRSRDEANKPHDYLMDYEGTVVDEADEWDNSVYDALTTARGRAYQARRERPRFAMGMEPEDLDDFAGWAELMEMVEGAEKERMRQLLIWPREVHRELEEARYKPEKAGAGAGEDAQTETQGGGGPLVRCLRMLAVGWGVR